MDKKKKYDEITISGTTYKVSRTFSEECSLEDIITDWALEKTLDAIDSAEISDDETEEISEDQAMSIS